MTWSMATSNGYESDKIAAFAIPYMQGHGLDVGCGPRKVWPSAIGLDSCKDYGGNRPEAVDIVTACDALPMIADGSMGYVFSSHLLEHFHEAQVPGVLKEWARVLKEGGKLILYVPHADFYPKVGEDGANPDHKWNIFPGDVERHLKAATDCGWTQLEREERSGGDEYSLFLVFEKRRDGEFVERIWERNPGGRKRCLVSRYGAIGDQIQTSSILPLLKEQGYHVTYNTTPEAAQAIKHDPHIDEWFFQEKDLVPNAQLGPFWETLRVRYDHFINLSESVEAGLLTIPGRLQHQYPLEARQKLFGTVNYLERTHDIANVPHRFRPKFYATDKELYWARKLKREIGGPVVLWGITGSSVHKVYPWVQVVAKWLLQKTPCSVVFTADGGIGKVLQDALIQKLKDDGADLSRVHAKAGEWDIRQALSFAQVADCVVGPETGLLNAVCMEDGVAKVIYLSHSTHENLTKHWTNTTVLEPDRSRAPCSPCLRLHYDWSHCHQDETTNAALCASAIKPEKLFEAIALSIGARKAA